MQWRYALSSTMRGIYVIRLFLFAGGTAIALAIAEQLIFHTERPLLGLAVGFAVGLVVFRGQLRPLRWPRLLLSKTTLHLIQNRRVVSIPWGHIRKVTAVDGMVAIDLAQPMLAPDGQPAEAIRLEARKFGTASSDLAQALGDAVSKPERRETLPPEDRVQAALSASGG